MLLPSDFLIDEEVRERFFFLETRCLRMDPVTSELYVASRGVWLSYDVIAGLPTSLLGSHAGTPHPRMVVFM
jgi:hypothetical protein